MRILLSSYAPLSLILFARIADVARYGFLVLAVLGFVDALRITDRVGKLNHVPRHIVAVRDAGSEIAAYLATYLLPFLAAPHAKTGDIIGYVIFAVVVSIVTLRSDLAHVNPTMYLLGFRVVTVTLDSGRERYLVCKKAPKANSTVYVAELYGVLQSDG
jgi:hypothetical protein